MSQLNKEAQKRTIPELGEHWKQKMVYQWEVVKHLLHIDGDTELKHHKPINHEHLQRYLASFLPKITQKKINSEGVHTEFAQYITVYFLKYVSLNGKAFYIPEFAELVQDWESRYADILKIENLSSEDIYKNILIYEQYTKLFYPDNVAQDPMKNPTYATAMEQFLSEMYD